MLMTTEYLLETEVQRVLMALTPVNRLVVRTMLHTGLRVGDVLELRYCEDRTLQEIAGTLGVSVRSIQADLSAALDWVNLTGLARARQGRGAAEI